MRKSKTKLLITLLCIVILLLGATIAVVFIGKNQLDNYKVTVAQLQTEIETNTKTVYVAMADIPKGEKLVEDYNVMRQTIYSGIDAENYITEENLGSFAIVDIPYEEPIYKNMITPLSIDNDTREYEISFAHLMTSQTENDVIDLRIMFPNGEDYIVLSKKTVKNLSLENNVFFSYLSEDEILRTSSAIIDAFTVSGTKLYTTRYVEGNLQEEAIPNYPVKASTLELINSDPNIINIAIETLSLKARTNLESRLNGLSRETLDAVVAGHDIEDTARTSVLESGSYNTEGNYTYDEDGNLITDDEMSEDEIREDAMTNSDTNVVNQNTSRVNADTSKITNSSNSRAVVTTSSKDSETETDSDTISDADNESVENVVNITAN